MTRKRALLLGFILTISCATAGPIAVKCGLQTISIAASDYAEISADVHSKNWSDLAQVAERIGYATLDCVLGDEAAQDPSIKPAVDEFKRLHSVEFRAAGVSACRSPGDSTPPAGPVMPGIGALAWTYQQCDARCGSGNGLVTPTGCKCHVGLGIKAHWIAAR